MEHRYGFIKNEDVRTNFDKIKKKLVSIYNISELYTLNQVHSDVILIDKSGTGDGIIITKPLTGALIKTADCFPVVLVDVEKNISGIFHSGWKGTELGISAKGAEIMSQMGCESIEAVVFSGIHKCCFEIGNELFNRFKKAEIPVEKNLEGKIFADMKSAIINGLKAKGIQHIKDFSECTCCSKGYFSYRKDKTEKRHGTFVINFS